MLLQLLVDIAGEYNICELGPNVFLSKIRCKFEEKNFAGYRNACELSVNEDSSFGG